MTKFVVTVMLVCLPSAAFSATAGTSFQNCARWLNSLPTTASMPASETVENLLEKLDASTTLVALGSVPTSGHAAENAFE